MGWRNYCFSEEPGRYDATSFNENAAVGRLGYVDLDDTLIKGGKMRTRYAGMNWWASRQWKLGVGYGLADLDKSNTTGRTQRLIMRLQWIY
jgi:hypothetical protein